MTFEEFKTLYTENPNDDNVMTEISRLYESESKLTADFNAADIERNDLRKQVEDLNKKYRERFLTGTDDINKQINKPRKADLSHLFKKS